MTSKYIFYTEIEIEAGDQDEAVRWFDYQMAKTNGFLDRIYVAEILEKTNG
jgi:hypothetical protein